mmetsp:Transcript_16543/g.53987  ORF Transcript_16543/g.53987 Transcript_16543/m.53987 type:complete len:427 (+) Transcript_16543:6053-7333(+)
MQGFLVRQICFLSPCLHWSSRSNIASSACMCRMARFTCIGSVPSERSDCMGPWSSLLTMERVHSSTVFLCFLVSPSPMRPIALSSSADRMVSALERSRLMVGTVSSESRHDSNASCSSARRPSASRAAAARAALFASTTSRRSSTLNTCATSPSSLTSASTLRGTAMSKRRRVPPTASPRGGIPSRSALRMRGSSEKAAVKMRSASSTQRIISGRSSTRMSISGKSALSASAEAAERFTMVMVLHFLELKCFTSNRDILPAPTMHTLASSKLCVGSLSCASSAAALDTDTAPEAMVVSARTRLPALTAAEKSPFKFRPNPSHSATPFSYTDLTCAKICPSPITRLSKPADTFSKCCVASRSRSRNKCSCNSGSGMPDFATSHSSTSRTPLCHESATTYTSMRLHVDKTAASSMCGYEHSSSMARGH